MWWWRENSRNVVVVGVGSVWGPCMVDVGSMYGRCGRGCVSKIKVKSKRENKSIAEE